MRAIAIAASTALILALLAVIDARVEKRTIYQQITTPEPLGVPVEGHCGKQITTIHTHRDDIRHGLRFNCIIKNPLQKTHCTDSCDLNGQEAICQVEKYITRRKGYTCTLSLDGDQATLADPEQYNYETQFEEMVPDGCQCFKLGHCGKKVFYIAKHRRDTQNNISFNCNINKPLKKTLCTKSCDLNGRQVVCTVQKYISIPKAYTCTPSLDGDQEGIADPERYNYVTHFEETVPTGCQCFTQ